MAQQKPTLPALPITLTASPISTSQPSDNSYQVTLHVTLEPEDWIYHDYITLSCDAPHISLSAWQPGQEPVARYVNSFKETKRVYPGSFSITSIATFSDPATISDAAHKGTPANLHLTYYKKSDKKITHHLVPLILSDRALTTEQSDSTNPQRQLAIPTHAQTQPDISTQENSAQETFPLPETSQIPKHEQQAQDFQASAQNCVHTTHAAPTTEDQSPFTYYLGQAHTLFTHTAHRAVSYTSLHSTSYYTARYGAEIHQIIIIILILIFSVLKQKKRLVSAAQNMAIFILVWCYYAIAGTAIPAHTCWLLTATLNLFIGILIIKKAEDVSPALVSKRAYRYLYYFLIMAGMSSIGSSLILYAKAAQSYYIYSTHVITQTYENTL